jgi:hypothetical protein
VYPHAGHHLPDRLMQHAPRTNPTARHAKATSASPIVTVTPPSSSDLFVVSDSTATIEIHE